MKIYQIEKLKRTFLTKLNNYECLNTSQVLIKQSNSNNNKNHNTTLMRALRGCSVINRPGVAGAVLQTSLSLIDSLSQRSFSSKPSKHHYTQTVTAREF